MLLITVSLCLQNKDLVLEYFIDGVITGDTALCLCSSLVLYGFDEWVSECGGVVELFPGHSQAISLNY